MFVAFFRQFIAKFLSPFDIVALEYFSQIFFSVFVSFLNPCSVPGPPPQMVTPLTLNLSENVTAVKDSYILEY